AWLLSKRPEPAAGVGGSRRLAPDNRGLPPGQPRQTPRGGGRGAAGRLSRCGPGHRRPQPGTLLGIVRRLRVRPREVWPGPRRRLAGPGGLHLAAPPGRPREKRMNHLTCDLCGKDFEAEEEVRYEVRIEVKAAYDPLRLAAEDLNKDYRAEIAKVL